MGRVRGARGRACATVTLVACALLAACGGHGHATSGQARAAAARPAGSPHPVLTTKLTEASGVFSVATDRRAAFVGFGGGIVRVDTDDGRRTWFHLFGEAQSLTTGGGYLWVVTPSGVLQVDEATGRVLHRFDLAGAHDLSWSDGVLWGLRDGPPSQLLSIDPASGRIRVLALPEGKVLKVAGLAVGDGAIWLSAAGDVGGVAGRGEVVRVDPTTGRVVSQIAANDGFGSLAVGDGAVWASNGADLVRIDPTTDRATHVTALLPASAASLTLDGSGMIRPGRGVVWFTEATGRGAAHLVAIDPTTGLVEGDGVAVGRIPTALAAGGTTAWVVGDAETLYRVDLVDCPPGHCRAVAPTLRLAPAAVPVWLDNLRLVTGSTGWALRWTADPSLDVPTHLTVARTTDGGSTWNALAVPGRGPIQLLETEDPDRARLLRAAGGRRWMLYDTDDGGRSWSHVGEVHPPRAGAEPRAMDFVGSSDGWILEDLGAAMGNDQVDVLATTDGGATWSTVAATPPIVGTGGGSGNLSLGCDKTGITFRTATTGWITGACNGPGVFFEVTHDGGREWTPQSLPFPAGACGDGACQITAPVFFGSTGYITATAGSQTLIFATRNSGTTWSLLPTPALAVTADVDPIDAGHLAVLTGRTGSSRLIMSADSGRTWRQIDTTPPYHVYSSTIDFATPSTGVLWTNAADASGIPPLYRTTDEGGTWKRVSPRLTDSPLGGL